MDVESIIGRGKAITGFHPNSARVWSLGHDTFFEIDAEHVNNSGSYSVDYILLYKGKPHPESVPRARYKPSIVEAYLGEHMDSLIRRLNGGFRWQEAYDRDCLVWHGIDPSSHKKSTIYAASTKGIVDLIEMDIRD